MIRRPLEFIVYAAVLTTAILLYYSWRGKRVEVLESVVQILAAPLRHRFPARHVDAVCALGYAAILQVGFFVLLALAIDKAALSPQSLFYCDPVLILLGVVLGIGEMGLSTLLGFAAIVAVDSLQKWSKKEPRTASQRPVVEGTDWSTTARGGWMQYYLKAITILPRPVGVASVLLYVFFEEGVFRGVVLGSLAPFGWAPALGISVALFMIVQTFHTPGWRTAIFPVIGALVLGIVNGALFLTVPKIMPLALAHASFFFSAIWSVRKFDAASRMSILG
jgi:Type II CAAX prenyl endopeptidase Rce1-like